MFKSFFFFILLVITVFIESVYFPYPIFFITLALFFFFEREIIFFILALLFSLFFDMMILRNPPGTVLFLSLFLIFLYIFERLFSALDIRIYMLFVFFATEAYRFYAGYPFEILTSIIFFIMLMTFGIIISRKQKAHV